MEPPAETVPLVVDGMRLQLLLFHSLQFVAETGRSLKPDGADVPYQPFQHGQAEPALAPVLPFLGGQQIDDTDPVRRLPCRPCPVAHAELACLPTFVPFIVAKLDGTVQPFPQVRQLVRQVVPFRPLELVRFPLLFDTEEVEDVEQPRHFGSVGEEFLRQPFRVEVLGAVELPMPVRVVFVA